MNTKQYTVYLIILFSGSCLYSMVGPVLAGESSAVFARGLHGLIAKNQQANHLQYEDARVIAYGQLFKRTQPLKSPWSWLKEAIGIQNHQDTEQNQMFLLPKPDRVYPEGTKYGRSGREMPLNALPNGSWQVVRGWEDHGIQQGDYGHQVHVCKRNLISSTGTEYEQVAKQIIDEIMVDGKSVNLNKRGFQHQLICNGCSVNLEDGFCETVEPDIKNLINNDSLYIDKCFMFAPKDDPRRIKYATLDDLIEAGFANDKLVSLAIELDDMIALEKLLKAIGSRPEPSMCEDYVKKDTARQVRHYYGGREQNKYNLLAEAMLSVHLGHTYYAQSPKDKLESILKYDKQDPRFKEAIEYLLKHGNLSLHMQLKGAKAIGDEQMVVKIHKKIASRIFTGLLVGTAVAASKLAYDYMSQQEEKNMELSIKKVD